MSYSNNGEDTYLLAMKHINNNNNTFIYKAPYPANTACSRRLYIYTVHNNNS